VKTDFTEIDEGSSYIGFDQASAIIKANIPVPEGEELPLGLCAGRIASADITASVSYPSRDVSLKDGFSVKSDDVADASSDKPVSLAVTGSVFAGGKYDGIVKGGEAVKICSGAQIPAGTDAVVSGEFCRELSFKEVLVKADAGPGRNILKAGIEVEAGEIIINSGEKLFPGKMGLAAAAGINIIKVYRRPSVAVISIGDEVVSPGAILNSGQLYASNMINIKGWLDSSGITSVASIVADDEVKIRQELNKHLHNADVILTSGGAWGSERDLVIGILDKLRWQKLFHYVRMGPGKGISFGLLEGVPVFCLPGGPASNQTAFLQLALPALFQMSGENRHPLQTIPARLTEDVKSRHHAWTEFKDAFITPDGSGYAVSIYRNRSRLQAIAGANALICIPAGKKFLIKDEIIPVQLLTPLPDYGS